MDISSRSRRKELKNTVSREAGLTGILRDPNEFQLMNWNVSKESSPDAVCTKIEHTRKGRKVKETSKMKNTTLKVKKKKQILTLRITPVGIYVKEALTANDATSMYQHTWNGCNLFTNGCNWLLIGCAIQVLDTRDIFYSH